MALKSESIPTHLDEFRSLKLNGMIRDMQKLSYDELVKVKNEIERLLTYEGKNA